MREKQSRGRGFTLVELIVATGITLLLASLLIGTTSAMLSAWNRSRGGLTSSNQARLALGQLGEDLSTALFRLDGGTWLAATILDSSIASASVGDEELEDRGWVLSGPMSVKVKPRTNQSGGGERTFDVSRPEIADCRFGMAGVWLRFFGMKQDRNEDVTTLSAPAAISYQIVRRHVGSSTSQCVYSLYRSVVSPENTFAVGFDLAAKPYNTPVGIEDEPGTVSKPSRIQVVANDVIDFGIRCYVRENGELRLIFPAQPATLGALPLHGKPSGFAGVISDVELQHLAKAAPVNPDDAYRNRFPDVVEVMIRVLTEEGRQMIQALEAGRADGDWWGIAEQHSQVYTRTIDITASGL